MKPIRKMSYRKAQGRGWVEFENERQQVTVSHRDLGGKKLWFVESVSAHKWPSNYATARKTRREAVALAEKLMGRSK